MIKAFKFIEIFKKIKSPYILGGVSFLFWMLLFDAENFVVHYKMKMILRDLAKDKQYYIDQKRLIEKEKERINGDLKLLEKFAREKYFMKRKNEDLYIIQEK